MARDEAERLGSYDLTTSQYVPSRTSSCIPCLTSTSSAAKHWEVFAYKDVGKGVSRSGSLLQGQIFAPAILHSPHPYGLCR
jgi:hypothetical protein